MSAEQAGPDQGYDPDCPHCVKLLGAVVSRGTIEQAKGMLMQALGVDADTAFDVLRDWSRDTNTKLWRVADAVVARKLSIYELVAR